MEYPTEQANAYLDSATADPAPAPEATPVEASAVENTSAETAPVEQGTTAQPDSHTDIDLSALSPEYQAAFEKLRAEGMMRADYTQKTQALAEERRQLEALGDFAALQEARQLAATLQSDPQAFYKRLGDHLGVQATATDDYEEEPTGFQIPPELQRELDETRQWRSQMQEQQRLAEAAEAFNNNLNQIREGHPEYKERDLDRVSAFGFATGGNLVAANDLYQEMRREIISEFIASKEAVPTSVTVPAGGATHAEVPRQVSSWDEAKKIARETIANLDG